MLTFKSVQSLVIIYTNNAADESVILYGIRDVFFISTVTLEIRDSEYTRAGMYIYVCYRCC